MNKLIFVFFILGLWLGGFVMLVKIEVTRTHNSVLIKQNHAYYHPQTGNFTLKECKCE